MNAAEQALYEQIVAFEIDEPGVALTFVKRLARENAWQPKYAQRVLVEYKRFLFLAMVAGHVVTPAEEVDQAWHLHLTYTRSYWDRLCQEVLKKPLHHCPTQGGQAEQARYIALYEQTLASYRQYFGHAPPDDIWPSAKQRFGEDIQHVNVNTARHWIVPKPSLQWLMPGRRIWRSASAAGIVALPLAAATWNPLDWHGEQFLIFYFQILLLAAALAGLVRWLWPPEGMPLDLKGRSSLDPYDVACLAAGPIRAVHAALGAMVQAQTLTIGAKSKKFLGLLPYNKTVIEQGEPLAKDAPALEQAMYAAAADSPSDAKPLLAAGLPIAQEMEQDLVDRGLLQSRSWPAASALVASLIMVSPLILGIAKVCIGVMRHRPVGFLIAYCFVTVVLAGCFLFVRSRFTKHGRRLYRALQQQHADTRTLAQTASDTLPPWELAMAIGLFGVGTLAMGQLAQLRTLLPPAHGGLGTYAGGCGTGCGSGCGSGCGGGGCGGGGCGGCGS